MDLAPTEASRKAMNQERGYQKRSNSVAKRVLAERQACL
jgi:hypothetical protein